MQEMAIFGAQVLDMRAAMLAAKYQVPLLIAHAHKKNLQALKFLTQIK
jgi:aspartokinase